MGLWWLQEGWADATCAVCGVNIKSTGGDPDWGLCWPHMQQQVEQNEHDRQMVREAEAAYYRQIGEQQEREIEQNEQNETKD
jgi:hypothetical protein